MAKLQDQLDQITERTRGLVQPERLRPVDDAIAELFASGIEQQILAVGSVAPEFALPDNNGRTVRSSDLLALGPVIIKFFRGRWCPYCMAELAAWRDSYPQVRTRGALLVAISPQTVHQNDLLVQQHPLPFPVLSDAACAVAKQFGLVYNVSPPHQKHFRSILVNIPFINGDPEWRLPLPATYVIGSDGRIAYAQAHADFRVRPDPEEVLAAL
ncbi:MAG: redoxin domain-containing protein [Acidobacteriaceae bacterium]